MDLEGLEALFLLKFFGDIELYEDARMIGEEILADYEFMRQGRIFFFLDIDPERDFGGAAHQVRVPCFTHERIGLVPAEPQVDLDRHRTVFRRLGFEMHAAVLDAEQLEGLLGHLDERLLDVIGQARRNSFLGLDEKRFLRPVIVANGMELQLAVLDDDIDIDLAAFDIFFGDDIHPVAQGGFYRCGHVLLDIAVGRGKLFAVLDLDDVCA